MPFVQHGVIMLPNNAGFLVVQEDGEESKGGVGGAGDAWDEEMMNYLASNEVNLDYLLASN